MVKYVASSFNRGVFQVEVAGEEIGVAVMENADGSAFVSSVNDAIKSARYKNVANAKARIEKLFGPELPEGCSADRGDCYCMTCDPVWVEAPAIDLSNRPLVEGQFKTLVEDAAGDRHAIKFGAVADWRVDARDLARGLSTGIGRPGVKRGTILTVDGEIEPVAVVVVDHAGSVVYRFVDLVDVGQPVTGWRHRHGLVTLIGSN